MSPFRQLFALLILISMTTLTNAARADSVVLGGGCFWCLDAAYRDHPERFVRRPPSPPQLPKEVWINKPLNSDEDTH